MAASENGAFPGGKVGGVGDVMRDLPRALASQGHDVTVLTPSYGVFHRQAGAERVASIPLTFGGRRRRAALYRVEPGDSSVRQLVIEHRLITGRRPGRIYHDDGPDNPFATDATRFAFFAAALASLLERTSERPDVMHLHDWHTAMLLFLRRFDQRLAGLRNLRCVFTIHNLAYQGIRPLRAHSSSLEAWFPGLEYSIEAVADPRYRDCVNPMALSIRLADAVGTVSPGYAREIREPSDSDRGFSGGEGLEADLERAHEEDRLTGILNGATYPRFVGRRPGWSQVVATLAREPHLLGPLPEARSRIKALPQRRPRAVLTSIGRITEQKVSLLLQSTDGQTALDSILSMHPGAMLLLLGSGDTKLEESLAEVARGHANLLFLRGYSEELAEVLYRAGDLFLMPSSFEPCGISQMLAMRAGQPCVAHAVGGLRDTITDGRTGFTFTGANPRSQARGFVDTVARALRFRTEDPDGWRDLRAAAASERFTWDTAARRYTRELYAC